MRDLLCPRLLGVGRKKTSHATKVEIPGHRRAAGKRVFGESPALLPSAGFFSLSIRASPRDPAGVGRSAEMCGPAFRLGSPSDGGGPRTPIEKDEAPSILPARGFQGDKQVEKWTYVENLVI